MKIEYNYEPDWGVVESRGFGIPYKPDFWLPKFEYWVEVKAEFKEIATNEFMKIEGLAKLGDVLVLSGPPRLLGDNSSAHHLCTWGPRHNRLVIQDKMRWCECPTCRRIGIEVFGGVPSECRRTCTLFGDDVPDQDGHRAKRLMDAYRYAQNYKF
jgi:hypothetical protein